ncbi:preprotein translocase subunit TatB [Roseivivax halodurans JCM 10272]|uniref:Sec-independent protein translocase protein TatB n=1 Tax=Roseivivax halodurans JCM 10272 TaxID=1449350 RepID=X7EKK5_9RHOB|nr:Sec-independent protein translocase protein TatB [Roseivivax halodurans]ETX16422.1 preprotein translocase subunit TatB [Roseivivax halodurans JCM 10272]
MLDLGFAELLVIGIVALIVVGPKDLPVLFRNVGRFVGKAKGMAREFSRAMNDAADESGIRDAAKTFKSATNPMASAMDGVKDAARSMKDATRFDDLELDDHEDPGLDRKKTKAPDPQAEAKRRKIEAASARAAAERKRREADDAARKADEMEASLGSDDKDNS